MVVNGLDKIGIVRNISITKRINNHSKCVVNLLLDDKTDISKLKGKIGNKVSIEDDKRIYMRGKITLVTLQKQNKKSLATIEITSISCDMSQVFERRVFQRPGKKYKDIIEIIKGSSYKTEFLESDVANKEVDSLLVVQDGCSDFDFILNLAKKLDLMVFINDTDQTSVASIGQKIKGKYNLKEEDIIYEELFSDQCCDYIKIKNREYYDFGKTLSLDGKDYIIIEQNIFFENNCIYYNYLACYKNKAQAQNKTNICYVLGKAEVKDINDPDNKGRIQVEFKDYNDVLADKRLWIPYITNLTEKDGGVILIPDVGEFVFVFVTSDGIFANGCLREIELGENSKEVKNRIFTTRDTKFVLSDKKIEMEAYEWKLSLDKDKLEVTKDEFSLNVSKNIVVKNGNAKVNMTSDTVQILADSNVEIKSKKLKEDVDSSIEMKSSQIRMNGNSKVDIKTASLNIG